MTITKELLHRLPKAELHVHLDGSIRPQTMLDLARDQRVSLPTDDPEQLANVLYVRQARSLEQYLERYATTLSVMQTGAALERIAYEFVLDAAAENVRYVEVRYCPALHTPSVSLTSAVEAPLAGLKRAEADTGTVARLIVCGLRTLPPRVSTDMAKLAVDYMHDGVVAFDLAGAEHGQPAEEHRAGFEFARGHGLSCTCHAGEGDGPESIANAIHVCGAQRIGHGTRLQEDPELEAWVMDQQVPLEVCLSSNVHTHTVTSLDQHPMPRYLRLGGMVTLNTDSRLIDGTTLSNEYWVASQRFGLTRADIDRLILNACRSAFLPAAQREKLVDRVRHELDSIE